MTKVVYKIKIKETPSLAFLDARFVETHLSPQVYKGKRFENLNFSKQYNSEETTIRCIVKLGFYFKVSFAVFQQISTPLINTVSLNYCTFCNYCLNISKLFFNHLSLTV